jgi:uncharacterized protein YhbP (UPF0306 family)
MTGIIIDPKRLLKQYFQDCHMMQLATVSNGRPWACTVYFLADDENNLYWASIPSRRHSQEIVDDPRVAAAIPVQFIKGEPVVGIQVEGTAKVLTKAEEIEPIAAKYAEKFSRDKQWTKDISAAKTEHQLYKLSPKSIIIFDEQNFSANPRIKIK